MEKSKKNILPSAENKKAILDFFPSPKKEWSTCKLTQHSSHRENEKLQKRVLLLIGQPQKSQLSHLDIDGWQQMSLKQLKWKNQDHEISDTFNPLNSLSHFMVAEKQKATGAKEHTRVGQG